MPWFPVKKIRKQIKLLLLLVLLTCAAWLTYVHLSLVRQGRALRQRLGYGRGTGGGARPGAGGGAGPQQRGSGPSFHRAGLSAWARPARRPRPPFPARQYWGWGRGSTRSGRPMTSSVRSATLLGSAPEPRRTPDLARTRRDRVNGGTWRGPPQACPLGFPEAKPGCRLHPVYSAEPRFPRPLGGGGAKDRPPYPGVGRAS